MENGQRMDEWRETIRVGSDVPGKADLQFFKECGENGRMYH